MLTDELPQEFAAQATLLPLPLRRLICDGANPATVPAAAVVHALRMPVTQFRRARAALAPPADEILLRIPAVLSAKTCARLRTAVDEGAATNPDSVDGLADHQLDCRTMDELARLCGDPDVIETLKALPAQFAADEKRTAALGSGKRLLKVRQAFVRRYTLTGRPWFNFHMDTGPLTVNIALSDDAKHEGGRLLGLIDGRVRAIERAEGEATVHPSCLLHGVSRMTAGVRYSLIVFWKFVEEEAEAEEEPATSIG